MAHGIMFHYFHSDNLKRTQGSIDEKVFEDIIKLYSTDHNILTAEDFKQRAKEGTLRRDDICLTFDDGLYSQFAVASPVLKRLGLTAFYFVYTSPMEGVMEKIEIFRAFRNHYANIDLFYDDFFQEVCIYGEDAKIDYERIIHSSEAENYHSQYEYYSKNDRVFRYLRDIALHEKYDQLMNNLMTKRGFDATVECKNIWIQPNQLKKLRDDGNVIGLHSHTHPTSIAGLTYAEKVAEYKTNKQILTNILDQEVDSASYPCDTYDEEIDHILTHLDVNIAFIAHMENEDAFSLHRIPRIDSSIVVRNMR